MRKYFFMNHPPWNKAKCQSSIFCVRVSYRILARLTINYEHKFHADISQVQTWNEFSSAVTLKYSLFRHTWKRLDIMAYTLPGFNLIERCVKHKISRCTIWHYLIRNINVGFRSLIYFMFLSWVLIKRRRKLRMVCKINFLAFTIWQRKRLQFPIELNSLSVK